MDNIPVSKTKNVGYRTTTNSSEQNKFNNDVLYDVLNLFNTANKLELDMAQTKENFTIEETYTSMKINEMQGITINLRNKINATNIFNIFPKDCYILDNNKGADINLVTNDITTKSISSISKLNIYDNISGTLFVPDELILTVSPEADGINIIDTEITNAFGENDGNYYVRKVITDNTINDVTVDIEITLPDEVITSRDINVITINPFPFQGCDIMNIQYMYFGTYIPLPAFETHIGNSLEKYTDIFANTFDRPAICDSPNLKLSFKDTAINKLKISLRQRKYIQDGDRRIFYLGLKNISVYNKKYSTTESEVYALINLNTALNIYGKTVAINGINAVLNNPKEMNKPGVANIQYEFYYLDSANGEHIITDSFPFTVPNNRLLIKAKIYNDDTTPNINRFELNYTLKS